jgi:dipeptide/tripeptide permease
MPLFGAYMAEKYFGRFKTIQFSILIALIGHVILIISAIPLVIVHPNGAIACFAIGIVIMCVGVGGFKSNISVLIAEQSMFAFLTFMHRLTPESPRKNYANQDFEERRACCP